MVNLPSTDVAASMKVGLSDARNSLIRVAICATHPIQYQAPLWRLLARQPGLHVRAFFGTDMSIRGYRDPGFGVSVKWDTPLLDGYEHEFISTDPKVQQISFTHPGFRGIYARLRAFAPDVVVLTAYASLFHLGSLRAARRLGAKVVMRHEASDIAQSRSRFKGAIRDILLRVLYNRVDEFAAIGTEARRHLIRLGIKKERIGFSPYCVDSDFMETQVENWQPQRANLRTEIEARPDDIVFVFAGKLVAKKDPLLIVSALKLLPEELRQRIHLVVAGDGELKSDLESQGRAVLGPRLHTMGFLNQSEIGRAYTMGDVLILPSRRGEGETWGLVVNEAMQFGLPAIVSDGVGSRSDLVEEGEAGFSFQSGDATELSYAIKKYAALLPARRLSMSEDARRRVKEFTIDEAARGLSESILKLNSQR